MKKIISSSSFLVLLLVGVASAQSPTDALRFSQTAPTGTARMLGVGNAFTALGADLGVLSINPAGLAMFRSSEFVFSPGYATTNTKATLQGEGNSTISRNAGKLQIGSTGFVWAHEPRNASRWKSVNAAIAYNRTASYRGDTYYQGKSEGSIAHRWTEDAQASSTFDPFSTNLAFETAAIYDTNQDGIYENDFQAVPGVQVARAQNINTTGGQGDLQFALGANYDHRFMMGATIGVPFIRFNETKKYSESDLGDEVPYFNSLEFDEQLTTSGIGINAKVGFLFRISQALRFGLSAHTPTQFSMDDSFNSNLSYDYTDANHSGAIDKASPSGSFSYKFTTPWRFNTGLALILGENGFISADAEYVDYSTASFNFGGGSIEDVQYEVEVNNRIANDYKGGVNARIGAEYAYEVFRIRGGLGLNSSPYRVDSRYYPVYSFGLGLRGKRVYLDIAYRFQQQSDTYSPYARVDATLQPRVDERMRNGYALVTLGFK